VATVGDNQFLIRPKIGIRNLLALMDIGARHERWADDVFEFDSELDLLTTMVRLFLRSVERVLAQGLRRDYQRREDQLLTIRGRLDLRAAMRRPGGLMTLPCVFDDHTADVGANRLLLAAIRRALQVVGLSAQERRALHRLELMFEDVFVDADPLAWARAWVPNRLDQHYVPAVRIATLLLQNLSIRDQTGGRSATTFLVDMNKVVESFISEHLQQLLAGRLDVRCQYPMVLDQERRVHIRPDLVFLSNQVPVFVADIKYKEVSIVDELATSDLYQLLAYVTALALPSGALITCLTDATSRDTVNVVTVQRSGKRLELWPVDLSGSPADIQRELGGLADRIIARSWEIAEPPDGSVGAGASRL
jgi:5-methylcytosine-specific restriction enzyme subunit McrC